MLELHVVAGILRDANGRVLITDRSRASTLQQYWEFPGGKIEDGESSVTALCRELREELGVAITSCQYLCRLKHDYTDVNATFVTIDFYTVDEWRGTPCGIEGQELKWLKPQQLHEANLLPADAPLIDRLS